MSAADSVRSRRCAFYASRRSRRSRCGARSMATKLSEVWPALTRIARAEGVVHVGASNLEDVHASLFAEWIDRGHHASMSYLGKNAAIRSNPGERYPWARSVVAILFTYSP